METRASLRALAVVLVALVAVPFPPNVGADGEDVDVAQANEALANALLDVIGDGSSADERRAQRLAEAIASRQALAPLFLDASALESLAALSENLAVSDAVSAPGTDAIDVADALLAQRLQGTLPRPWLASSLAAERANLAASRELLVLLGGPGDPFARGTAAAILATRHQAAALGYEWIPVPLAAHASPSAAARAVLDLHGVAPTSEQELSLRALDTLPEPARAALTRFLDAFLAYASATRDAFRDASPGEGARLQGEWLLGLEELDAAARSFAHADVDVPLAAPDAPLERFRQAGVDLAPLFPARAELLQAALDLRVALAQTPSASLAPLPPVDVPPVLALALGDATDDTYAQDYALLVDAGGDDRYANNAGGSGVLGRCLFHWDTWGAAGAAAALLDLDGNDDYSSARTCGVRGGASWGSGLLLDAAGDDAYVALAAAPWEGGSPPAPVVQLLPDTPEVPGLNWGVFGFHGDPPVQPGDDFLGARVVEVSRELRFAVVDRADEAFLAAARADARVRYAEPDRSYETAFTPNDARYGEQYAPQDMRLPETWDVGLGTSARNVCVVDSGIRATHEELAARFVGGTDILNGDANPNDDHALGHGTTVAGVAAATVDNGVGVAGMGNVGLLAVKVVNAGGLSRTSHVAQGIRWCADNGGHVILLALGGPVGSIPVREAVAYAWSKGSLMVGAAGNNGNFGRVNYPARYGEVIAVACSDEERLLCGSSSYGPEIELAAPGFQVLTTGHRNDQDYRFVHGTSISAAHVAGVAALVWSLAPGLTNGDLREVLRRTAVDLGPAGCEELFGLGLPDAKAALDLALAGPLPSPSFGALGGCAAGLWGTNGGGFFGFGMLLDGDGTDTYAARSMGVNGGATFGVGALLDMGAGDDAYVGGENGVNGGGVAGHGFLLDESGRDAYRAEDLAVNGAGGNGFGFLLDGGGADSYHAGREVTFGANGGASSAGGVGFLLDRGGNDSYTTGTPGYAFSGWTGVNGGASFGGVGVLVDEGGDDVYTPGTDRILGREWAFHGVNGGAETAAIGVLVDGGGSDWYRAGGTGVNGGASTAGLGHLVDVGGVDRYEGLDTGVNGGGETGGRGYLHDGSGNDAYVGRLDGVNGGGRSGVGFLLDEAGDDEYGAGSRGANGGGSGSLTGQGAAGVGMLLDRDGNDRYVAGEWGTNGGGNLGAGFLVDERGDDEYLGGHHGSNGGAFGGLGLLVDQAGADTYGASGIRLEDSERAPPHVHGLLAPRFTVGLDAPARGDFVLGLPVLERSDALRAVVVEPTDPAAFLALAAGAPGVRYVEPNPLVPFASTILPDDVRFEEQYGPQLVRAPEAWNFTLGASERTLCVVDTGVRYTHEDLAGPRWLGGFDFVPSVDDADPMDDNGHGTHVTAIAAATLNNGKGIAGVAQAQFYAAKVLDGAGNGEPFEVAQGITWCVDQGADVVSMSLGSPAYFQVMEEAVQDAWQRGALLIAAAGNGDLCVDCVEFPAAHPEVVAVTCANALRDVCTFTSTGPEAELAAPGRDVLSAWGTSDTAYQVASGTSMSAPHVAGVALLVWSARPDLTACEVRMVLRETASDLARPGWDDVSGLGLIDAKAAVDRAVAGPIPACDIALPSSPGSWGGVNGGAYTGAGLLLDAAGDDRYLAGWRAVNGGGQFNGAGLLVDASGDDDYRGGAFAVNGGAVADCSLFLDDDCGADAPATGLLLDRRGGDRYEDLDDGVREDATVSPKGPGGAQLDLNRPPSPAASVDRSVIRPGSSVHFTDATVDDGLILSRLWDFGDGATSAQTDPTHAYQDTGVYPVSLTARDDAGDERTAVVATITVSDGAPPVLDPLANRTVNEGQVLAFVVSALDPDGDALTFAAQGVPTGATFSPALRRFSWTPAANQQGAHAVTFSASDGVFRDEATMTITVLDVGNRAPVIAAPASATGTAGSTFNVQVHVSDPDEDRVTVTAPSLPAGASLVRHPTATKIWYVRWPTTLSDAGTYTVNLTANDGRLETVAPLALNVLPNRPPTVPAVGGPALVQPGAPATFTASSTDPENTVVRFEWDFDAADGFQVQATGPSTTRTFAAMGERVLTVRAVDGHGFSSLDTKSVSVDDGITLMLALPGQDPAHVGVTARPVLRLLVRSELGAPVANATLHVEVRLEGAGLTLGVVGATTGEDGVALATLPNDSGTSPGVNLPGRHVVTALASAPSRPGAPLDDVEMAAATLLYTVAP